MRHTVVIHRPNVSLYRPNVVALETDDGWIKLEISDSYGDRVELFAPVEGQWLALYTQKGNEVNGHARTAAPLRDGMSEDQRHG